jgi:hypothetical protein
MYKEMNYNIELNIDVDTVRYSNIESDYPYNIEINSNKISNIEEEINYNIDLNVVGVVPAKRGLEIENLINLDISYKKNINYEEENNIDIELKVSGPSESIDLNYMGFELITKDVETVIRANLDSLNGYLEQYNRDFLRGDLRVSYPEDDYLQVPKQIDISPGPEELGIDIPLPDSMCEFGSEQGRTWVVFKDYYDDFIIGRSFDDGLDWDRLQKVAYTPLGGENPAITFDKFGHYMVAFEAMPAGAVNKEIWLIEKPYSGDYVRKVGEGYNPKFLKYYNGNIYLFYLSLDKKTIYYLSQEDNFNTRYKLRDYDNIKDYSENIEL